MEDPSTTIGKLLGEAKALGAGPETLDFPPLKLRSGAGEAPCKLLLFLTEAAMAARGIKWQRPRYPEEP